MSSLHDVVRSAALGTRNRPLAPAGLPEPVARALHAASGPELVLEAAAAYALARRGTIPSAPVTALKLPAASSAPVGGREGAASGAGRSTAPSSRTESGSGVAWVVTAPIMAHGTETAQVHGRCSGMHGTIGAFR